MSLRESPTSKEIPQYQIGKLGIAGALGLYLGLTGRRLSSLSDLLYSRLGTHAARAEELPSLRNALVEAPLSRHADKRETLRQLDAVLQQFQARCDPYVIA